MRVCAWTPTVQFGQELVDRYIATKTAEGLSPKTVSNHLTTLSAMLKVAMRWRLIGSNPVPLVERPRVSTPEMSVLSEVEIARLLAAYAELEQEADEERRPWWGIARRLTVVALGTAMRRGELLGLRWCDDIEAGKPLPSLSHDQVVRAIAAGDHKRAEAGTNQLVGLLSQAVGQSIQGQIARGEIETISGDARALEASEVIEDAEFSEVEELPGEQERAASFPPIATKPRASR